MEELQYAESHLHTVAVKHGSLLVIPEEFHRIKRASTYRILCVLDGECRMFLSGESFRMQSNDLCFLRPGDLYRTDPIETMNVLNLYFTLDAVDLEHFSEEELIEGNVVMARDFSDLSLLNRPFVVKNDSELTELALEMAKELPGKAALLRKRQNILLEMLLLRMTERWQQAEERRAENSGFLLVSAIRAFVAEHIYEKLTCQSVAEQFGYHPNYLNQIVRDVTGKVLHRYILEEKVKCVTHELMYTSKPIAQIAQDYSFYDSSHLTRCFFAVTHLRPSDVRLSRV